MPRYQDERGHVFDQIQESIFDSITLTDASVLNSTRSFFSDVQGKNDIDTNLRQNSILESKVSFQVQGMAIDAQVYSTGANITLLPELQEKSSMRLVIGEKDYWKGQMRMLTGKLNVVHELAGGTDAERYFAQYGLPKEHGLMFARGNHIVIPELQSFRLEWKTANLVATIAAGSSVKFTAQLKGFLRRPVQ